MELTKHLQKVKQELKNGTYTSEASVSQGILLPALNALKWPVFDTSVVIPEFTLEGRRVDYALCHPKNKPAVFIEVKNVGFSEGADRQLFEYAFHIGVPMAILTDGQEWSFYLPGEQGRYDERRVYKIDLLERSIDEAAKRLKRYLNYKKVTSGKALKSARSDYQNVARFRIIDNNLPKAWRTILDEPDSILLELLAEKVEDLCGYKPDLDQCSSFIEKQIQDNKDFSAQYTRKQKSSHTSSKQSNNQSSSKYVFKFKGQKITAKNAREVMVKLFKLLSKEDEEFFEKFASRKHGRKRRYLAKDKYDLYPGRPDIADKSNNAVEIKPGWWLGLHYSRKSFQKIINLALEVVDPQLRSKIDVKVH